MQILAFLAAGGVAGAQTVPDWSPETIVVSADRHGPLFWRISRGSGEVWILGVVGPLPEDLSWDRSQVTDLVDGAKGVLLQPRLEVGVFEGAWFLLMHRDTIELPNDAHLEDVLGEPLKSRFIETRTKLHRDADHYEDYVPAWAGIMLFGDYLKTNNFSGDEPGHTIKRLADKKDIPVHAIATYDPLPAIGEIGKLPNAASEACLKSALDDIEAESAHQAQAAEAWAKGDLAGMERNYSEPSLFACLQAVPSIAKLWAQNVVDTTKAVDDALDGGGKTLMVASLGTLLRKGGILDHLRAEGAVVEAPE